MTYFIPKQLQSIDSIRELLLEMMAGSNLCAEIQIDDCVARCKDCILNFANTPVDAQFKHTSVQLLLDNGLITKGQALELTLDYN